MAKYDQKKKLCLSLLPPFHKRICFPRILYYRMLKLYVKETSVLCIMLCFPGLRDCVHLVVYILSLLLSLLEAQVFLLLIELFCALIFAAFMLTVSLDKILSFSHIAFFFWLVKFVQIWLVLISFYLSAMWIAYLYSFSLLSLTLVNNTLFLLMLTWFW